MLQFAIMTSIYEANQQNYPEIELGKPIRPFSAQDVEDFLERRKTNPSSHLIRLYILKGNVITIAVNNLDRPLGHDHTYSPFGIVRSSIVVGPEGVKFEREGFSATIFNFHGAREFECSVTVSLEEESIAGIKKIGAFEFEDRRAFLIPEGKDLSTLEYTFTTHPS